MIKRFSSLFAGHIDLGDMGTDATPANDRRYNDEQLAGIFGKTEALAKTMDRLGYHTLWFAEHHFQHEGYEVIPNIPMFAVHLSHITEKLKFGCGFNIAPMWHPLRLAEDARLRRSGLEGRPQPAQLGKFDPRPPAPGRAPAREEQRVRRLRGGDRPRRHKR